MDKKIKNKIVENIKKLLKISSDEKNEEETTINSDIQTISIKEDIVIKMPEKPIKKEYSLPNVDLIENTEIKKIIDMMKEKNEELYIPIGSFNENIIIEKIISLPNLLVGGTIMSGKTTYINSIITTLLLTKKPEELRMIIYDSKGVDYSDYNNIPHLLVPIIKSEITFKRTMGHIEDEVRRRYKLLKNNNYKNITEYNDSLENKNNSIPNILIIIDDYISLSKNEDINNSIEYISKNGWNVNVFLIVVANHPSSRIIPTVSKVNFPSRLSFKVISKKDSVMILDEPGAEKLGEFGVALYKSNYSNELKKVKIPIYSDDEIKAVIEHTISQQKATYDNTLIMNDKGLNVKSSFDGEYAVEEEPLYNEIVEFVVTQGKASASLLQRRFHLGYNRAVRCIDLLEERGIIGPNNGSKPREVLVKLERKDEY